MQQSKLQYRRQLKQLKLFVVLHPLQSDEEKNEKAKVGQKK